MANTKPQQHLSVRLLPKFVIPIECWIDEAIDGRSDLPSRDDVRKSLVIPLLEQIQCDAGSALHQMRADGGVAEDHDFRRPQVETLRFGRRRVIDLRENGQTATRDGIEQPAHGRGVSLGADEGAHHVFTTPGLDSCARTSWMLAMSRWA